MKVMQINATVNSSTGSICRDLAKESARRGIDNRLLYTTGDPDPKQDHLIRVGDFSYVKRQAICSRLKGDFGFNSKSLTKELIRRIDDYQPDIVHLHNMHTHNCHLGMLFEYFKKRDQKLVWTFHDCWAFTGYCTHFTIAGCEKWKTECCRCPQYREYSLIFDRSQELFRRKKSLFSGLDLTIVTPSDWLAGIVKQSMFSRYPVRTIHNGIDTSVFRPVNSCFREEHGIRPDQKMILGAAFEWNYKKGLDVFCALNEQLDPDRYRIVLVGVNDAAAQKLPSGMIAVKRTNSPERLAEIYSSADVFVNPTREEVLGLVNIEANACGTPVITFDVGGSPECIDPTSGAAVACNDIAALKKKVEELCSAGTLLPEDCIARAALFDKRRTYVEYIKLYEDIYDRTSKAGI